MIPFFRKIRKKMADDNRPLKYARYAIGEIVLVVIGILIALSVSNYNQSFMDQKAEAAYLQGIRADLQKQIHDFNESISLNLQRITIINEMLDEQVRQGGFKRNDSIMVMFNKIISVTAPREINTTFTELLSGGDLNLVRNDRLKNEIVRFYQDLEDMVSSSNNNLNNVHQNHLLPVLISRTIVGNTGNYANYSGNLKDGIRSRNYPEHVKETAFDKLEDPTLELELINTLNLRALIEVLQKDRSQTVVESAQELIEHLESELRYQHEIEFSDIH